MNGSIKDIPDSAWNVSGSIVKELLTANILNVTVVLFFAVIFTLIIVTWKRNSKIILFNNVENQDTRKALYKHSKEMGELKDETLRYRLELEKSRESFKSESDTLKFKLERAEKIISTYQNTIEQKLAMIPSVQAAVEKMTDEQGKLRDQIGRESELNKGKFAALAKVINGTRKGGPL